MPTVRPIASFALSFLVAIECWMSVASASSVRTIANETGIGISVDADGSFEVTTRTPAWKFSGNVGSPLSHLAARRGRDRAGPYREVEFKYETSAAAARLGAIRIYDYRPVVIFKLVFLTAGKTSESFPTISSYPRNLHHLTYTATFGGFSFERFGPDGPWVFFDDQANTFIFSPASQCGPAAPAMYAVAQRSLSAPKCTPGAKDADHTVIPVAALAGCTVRGNG